MTTNSAKQINRTVMALLSVVVMVSISVAMVGTFCETACDADCQDESGPCCACLFCPKNIVMTQSEDNSNQLELVICRWTLTYPDLLSEQEWFTKIDYPPRNLS